MSERLYPTSREEWLSLRKQFVGASEIAALFDLSPHLTRYYLWASKSGLIAPTVINAQLARRGRYIERLVPMILEDERPSWCVEPNLIGAGGFYIADHQNRIGCTPDLFAIDPERGRGVVQVKSASSFAFKRSWLDEDGAPACPPWVALQASMEAGLSGAEWAAVIVIVSDDFEPYVFDIDLSIGVMKSIESEAKVFWNYVDRNVPPPLDYERDLWLVKKLHPSDHEPVLDLDAEPDFLTALDEHVTCGRNIKLLETRRDRAATKIRERLGNHAGATCAGWRISAKVTTRKEYTRTFPASSYRTLRLKPPNDTGEDQAYDE